MYTKFSENIRKTVNETHQLMQTATGDATMSWWIFEWIYHFKDGQIFVENDECLRQPSISRNNESI